MRRRLRLFGNTCALALVAVIAHAQRPVQSVDVFLGSANGGNVFVGATLPFGMVKAGPDIGDNTGNAGWLPTGEINGFSQTHVSGTGGGAKYGNILVQPVTGDVRFESTSSPRSDEHASPGQYSVLLTRFATTAEVTTTQRAALYRFEYPKNRAHGLLIDAGHCLSSGPNQHEDQHVMESEIRIISSREFAGQTTVVGGWNQQKKPYRVYFYAIADTGANGFRASINGKERTAAIGDDLHGQQASLLLRWSTPRQSVHLKLGISFVSIDKARNNVLAEIPSFNFEQVATSAAATWDKALKSIDIEGATPEQKTVFYTALYHTMLMPVDRTGENPQWTSDQPYYDDFYAIWDTFRTSGPLLTLIEPERQAGMVKALIDIYRHDGWLPDARSGNSNGRTQGGSNADFMIADAYVKHLPGINWPDAYAAMKHDAEVSPPDPLMQGRADLDDWKTLGYLPIEAADRPASRSMEYAVDDFELATLAHGLGYAKDAETYLKRSRNWENLWDGALSDDGVNGFIWSRHRDGSWKQPFDPHVTGTWGSETFYEGNSWTYSLFVPQDVVRLVQKSGGPQAFLKRLDRFFAVPGRYDVGNEPGFLAPYLYLWIGRHDRTVEQLRAILAHNFHSGPNGLPGNDDSGAMSSWLLFGELGIYPNAGQDVYLISSPKFARSTIHLGNGKTFVIEAEGVDDKHCYVTSAELNGKRLDRAWFRHADIANGGRLVLHMSASPGAWPSGDPPPSASDAQ